MSGIIIGIGTFFIIGLLHPVIIKYQYYFGIKQWWTFLVDGLICILISFFVKSIIVSALLGVLGFLLLWSNKLYILAIIQKTG